MPQIYQRLRDYYGPQYDIQTGVHHQGYGDEETYEGFWGQGSLFIDLPRSRVYDASFNCTPGYQASARYYIAITQQIRLSDRGRSCSLHVGALFAVGVNPCNTIKKIEGLSDAVLFSGLYMKSCLSTRSWGV